MNKEEFNKTVQELGLDAAGKLAQEKRLTVIKSLMKEQIGLPNKSKINDVDAMNWYNDLASKVENKQIPLENKLEIPSLGGAARKYLPSALVGGFAGHSVAGLPGMILGATGGLAVNPLINAVDKVAVKIPASMYGKLGRGISAMPSPIAPIVGQITN